MNYKTRLQANNTEVQNNNVDLQSILNTINSLPTAANLDAEITEQEEISISQDTIIDQIQAALEGKAGNNLDTSDATATAEDILKDKTAYVNGEKITGTHECSGGMKDTKTIYLDWSGDEEGICYITYCSNNQFISVSRWEADQIEAQGGAVSVVGDYDCTSNFMCLNGVLIATQDGETIYLFSSGNQEV